MVHELWVEGEGIQTFCLAGPKGDSARKLLEPNANLVWSCEADSYFEAMTKYYEHMNWGKYQSSFPEEDKISYKELGFV